MTSTQIEFHRKSLDEQFDELNLATLNYHYDIEANNLTDKSVLAGRIQDLNEKALLYLFSLQALKKSTSHIKYDTGIDKTVEVIRRKATYEFALIWFITREAKNYSNKLIYELNEEWLNVNLPARPKSIFDDDYCEY